MLLFILFLTLITFLLIKNKPIAATNKDKKEQTPIKISDSNNVFIFKTNSHLTRFVISIEKHIIGHIIIISSSLGINNHLTFSLNHDKTGDRNKPHARILAYRPHRGHGFV